MIQPVQNLLRGDQFPARRQVRTGDHQHRQVQGACSLQLGLRAGTTGVLAYDQLCIVALHQGHVTLHVKRPTRHNQMAIGQGGRVGVVHQPQQVMMLGLGFESRQMHPAQRQKHPFGRAAQRRHGRLDIGYIAPLIAGNGVPLRPGQRDQRDACRGAGLDCVSAHASSKGMGRVDHMGDGVVAQVSGQPRDPAKAPDPHRHWLSARLANPARIGKDRPYPPVGQHKRQIAGLGCAAKNQKGWGHG